MTDKIYYNSAAGTAIILLIIFTILLPAGIFAQKAYIQVEAKPGISVYVDNVFKGKTTADNEGLLIIDNIIPGNRTIKLTEEGSAPQEEIVNIKPGEVYSYKVRPFFPLIKISESGNSGQQEIEFQVGSLKIQSVPVSILIEIPSLGIDYAKSMDEWMAEKIPIGRYVATFILDDTSLSDTIEIGPDKTTHLMVNMLEMEVEEQNAEEGSRQFLPGISNDSVGLMAISHRQVRFPEYGITLGETNIEDVAATYPCEKAKNKCFTVCQVESLRFWDQKCDSIIDNVVISRHPNMSKTWQESMGFDWTVSYAEWVGLLEKLGYRVEILEKPYIKKQKGEKSLRARIEAFSGNIKLKLFFANGVEGISVNSKNTLDIIMVSLE